MEHTGTKRAARYWLGRSVGETRSGGRPSPSTVERYYPAVTSGHIDDVAEIFRQVGAGRSAAVSEILRYRPELSRGRDGNGLSIVRFAHYMGHPDILQQLISAGSPLDIFEAAAVDHSPSAETELRRQPDLAGAYDVSGRTALHIAAAYGSVSVIEVLAGAGASLDATSRDASSETPLHSAVTRHQIEALRALLRRGGDPNARRRDGATVLMIAAGQNHRDVTEMLVARNVDVDLRDGEGRTASDIAATLGHLELAARIRLGERYIDRRMA